MFYNMKHTWQGFDSTHDTSAAALQARHWQQTSGASLM
jgi:hypothetical protein